MGAEFGVTLQQFPSKAVEAYGEYEFSRLDRKLAMFRALPEEDRNLLPEFEQRIRGMAECVDVNARLLAKMAECADGIAPADRGSLSDSATVSLSNENSEPDRAIASDDPTKENNDTPSDVDKDDLNSSGVDRKVELSRGIRRGFTMLATDWSATGADERRKIYSPMVAAVDTAYEEAKRAVRSLRREEFRVVVPGAGAGRLAWELAHKGFSVEGCEESFVALLVGNYVMNSVDVNEGVRFYPYVHEHSNVRSKASVARGVSVPDVNPKDIPSAADFSMRAGRFVEAYEGQDNTWDAVASFLAFDVGETSIEYVRRVAQILKPGGVWVVVGPTPCVDGARGDGVHVSGEEFVDMIRKCGFRLVKHETMKSLYSADANSLRTVHVNCPFVVAIKVRPVV